MALTGTHTPGDSGATTDDNLRDLAILSIAPRWAPATSYTLNQQVISPAGDVVKANTAHTSAGAYATDVAKWVLSTTFGTTAVVNVKDYGAKGDGTTDDTAAIQAAITATGWPTNRAKVIFPAGDYQVTGSISINGGGATSTPHLVLEGHGARLKTATASNTIIAVTNSVISLTRIHFVGLFFLVNAAGAIGVSLNNAELCTFQRCGFLGSFATGIKITGTSTYNTVTNCEFGSLSRGIEIAGGCDYLSVDVCHFNEQLAGTPLNWIGQTVATAQSGIKITGNTFYGTGATLPVVYLTNASTCQISDNAFDRCPLGGIFFGTGGSADANLISANTFIRTGNADDIKINGGNRCVVSANVFGVRQSVTAGTYSNIRIADPFSTAQGSGNAVTGNTSASTAAELHSMIRFDAGCLNNAITGNVGRAIIVAAGAGTALTGNITA